MPVTEDGKDIEHVPSTTTIEKLGSVVAEYLSDPRTAGKKVHIINPETGETFEVELGKGSLNYTDGKVSRILIHPNIRRNRRSLRPKEYVLTEASLETINAFDEILAEDRTEIRKRTARSAVGVSRSRDSKPILRKKVEITKDPAIIVLLDKLAEATSEFKIKKRPPSDGPSTLLFFYGHKEAGEAMEQIFEHVHRRLGISDDEQQSYCEGAPGSEVVQLIGAIGITLRMPDTTRAFLNEYLRTKGKVFFRIYRSLNEDGSFNEVDSCEVVGLG